MIKKVINNDSSAILIPTFGACFQRILWMFVSEGKLSLITNIGVGVVFFMPLISLLGVYISIQNIIKKVKINKNIFALILNLIWLSFLIIPLLVMLLYPDLIVSV
ncbi:MAG: hypothetical protein K0Q49_1895 [Haloplasmataceae bacterium]|jgi:hypothetical protein|nr:hypothetical protein [Haloplasmataceae bacterium]